MGLDLQFGPNWRDGNFYEDTILGYGIFLCDVSFNRLGNKSLPVAEVAAARGLPDSEVLTCCKDSYYTTRVSAVLPAGIEEVVLEIIPLTEAGFLTAGVFTDVLKDSNYRVGTSRSSRQGSCIISFSLLWTFVHFYVFNPFW